MAKHRKTPKPTNPPPPPPRSPHRRKRPIDQCQQIKPRAINHRCFRSPKLHGSQFRTGGDPQQRRHPPQLRPPGCKSALRKANTNKKQEDEQPADRRLPETKDRRLRSPQDIQEPHRRYTQGSNRSSSSMMSGFLFKRADPPAAKEPPVPARAPVREDGLATTAGNSDGFAILDHEIAFENVRGLWPSDSDAAPAAGPAATEEGHEPPPQVVDVPAANEAPSSYQTVPLGESVASVPSDLSNSSSRHSDLSLNPDDVEESILDHIPRIQHEDEVDEAPVCGPPSPPPTPVPIVRASKKRAVVVETVPNDDDSVGSAENRPAVAFVADPARSLPLSLVDPSVRLVPVSVAAARPPVRRNAHLKPRPPPRRRASHVARVVYNAAASRPFASAAANEARPNRHDVARTLTHVRREEDFQRDSRSWRARCGKWTITAAAAAVAAAVASGCGCGRLIVRGSSGPSMSQLPTTPLPSAALPAEPSFGTTDGIPASVIGLLEAVRLILTPRESIDGMPRELDTTSFSGYKAAPPVHDAGASATARLQDITTVDPAPATTVNEAPIRSNDKDENEDDGAKKCTAEVVFAPADNSIVAEVPAHPNDALPGVPVHLDAEPEDGSIIDTARPEDDDHRTSERGPDDDSNGTNSCYYQGEAGGREELNRVNDSWSFDNRFDVDVEVDQGTDNVEILAAYRCKEEFPEDAIWTNESWSFGAESPTDPAIDAAAEEGQFQDEAEVDGTDTTVPTRSSSSPPPTNCQSAGGGWAASALLVGIFVWYGWWTGTVSSGGKGANVLLPSGGYAYSTDFVALAVALHQVSPLLERNGRRTWRDSCFQFDSRKYEALTVPDLRRILQDCFGCLPPRSGCSKTELVELVVHEYFRALDVLKKRELRELLIHKGNKAPAHFKKDDLIQLVVEHGF